MMDSAIGDMVRNAEPCCWINGARRSWDAETETVDTEVRSADDRLRRAAPLIGAMFPQVNDIAEPLRSPLLNVDRLQASFGVTPEEGRWLIKADHLLPIAGSIKARGGFHEVIAFAERLAIRHGLLPDGGDLTILAGEEARTLFARYTVAVGSTGNLGMSIGLAANALGFRAEVHMSHDAKAWKKDRLRRHGVTVIEHRGDYASAVAAGRAMADSDPLVHFVDDEHSLDLFAGYAAAAPELKAQLQAQDIVVDADHPLFVYVPCGVGGAPGGITYGLKQQYGDNVHCLFAEPVQAPCMLVQMLAGPGRLMSVYDLGLNNRTIADGLAVGQASPLVAPLMATRLDGIYTLSDSQLIGLVQRAHATEQLRLEPSAAAGIAGPLEITRTPTGRAYLADTGLGEKLSHSTHIIWTTGGALLPDEDFSDLLQSEGADLSLPAS